MFNLFFLRHLVPDLKQEFQTQIQNLKAENRQLRGKLNALSGKMAEHQLATAFRSRKRFALSEFFQNVLDCTRLNLIEVRERVKIHREDGKEMELDIVALSGCGRVVLVEVKKRLEKTPLKLVEDFQEKVIVYQKLFPEQTVLPAFLSLGGFVENALTFCQTQGIATALQIEHF